MTNFVRYLKDFEWDKIETLQYKDEDGNPSFKGVTRKKLLSEDGNEVRYFEVQPNGHTTLEKHQHTHIVIPIRGAGTCLVADQVYELQINDFVFVPTWAWHQFRAAENEPLGFVCIVPVDRDRPTLPTAQEIDEMRKNPQVSDFIRPRAVNP